MSLIWAFREHNVGFRKIGHAGSVAGRALERLEEFGPQGLANTAWAFATLGVQQQEELLRTVARRALVRLQEFNPQAVASTAWAFATLGAQHEELLGAIAGRASARLEEFHPEAREL